MSRCSTLLPLLGFAVVFAIFGCSVDCGTDDDAVDDDSLPEFDDDDEDEEDEEDDNPCNNHPPELLSIHYFLGGTEGQELSPPVQVSSSELEGLYIAFEYTDVDCNLPGGHQWIDCEDSGWEEIGVLPEELGCSTEDSGMLYGFFVSEACPEPAEGLRRHCYGQARWTDVSGGESNTMDFEFVVVK